MINVIKATGEIEPFNEEKVRASIKRAGINEGVGDEVLSEIKANLYDNITTSEIYKIISEYLGKSRPIGKVRYSLKQAIMQLGPTGYPFEDFISEILKMEGYKTQVGVIIPGKCVSHEIDIIAENDSKKLMVEAKFHNDSGTHTDLHVSLYTKARFDDIRDRYQIDEPWIITNTKLTLDAINFAQCVGMRVMGWNYPDDKSLRLLIEKWKLHPITVLDSLSSSQKQELMTEHVVLCKEIVSNEHVLDILNLPPDRKDKIISEAKSICGNSHT